MVQRLRFGTLLGASALLALTAAPASAQRIERIVSFGDSYADTGNFLRLANIPPASTVAYTTGRFSGGTNYIDTLSGILNAPIADFAIGGAQARNQNGSLPTWGLPYQVDQFLNVGPQDAGFPAIAPTFSPRDLVTVSIGGNDARQYEQIITAGGTPTFTVDTSILSARTQLDRLVAAGAPTISFLAGNTARLPEIAGNTTAQGIRATYSNTYNAALQQTLAGYANRGVVVHYLNLDTVLDRVNANPSAFGLTGVACPAFPPPLSNGSSTACLNPQTASQFLFYGDQLHLTSAGFAIVGRYVARQLQAPLNLGATAEAGLSTAQQFGRTLHSRMDLGSPRDGEVIEGARVFLVGDTLSRTVERSLVTDSYDLDATGATAGVELGIGANLLVGLAGNYSRTRSDFDLATARVVGKTMQVGAYANYALGPVFVQGHVAGGTTDYKVRRAGVIDNLNASPDGKHLLAGAKAGFLANLGNLRVGPVVALDYARARVDGYTEDGDAALRLNVGRQRASSLIGGAGVELRGSFGSADTALRPFATAMVEKELGDNDTVLTFSQTASPGIVNRFNLGRRDKSLYSRFGGGASASITERVQLDVAGSGTVGRDGGNELSAQVGVRVGF